LYPLRVYSRTPVGIAPRQNAEAVVLDLMQPIQPRRRPFGGQWQAGFDVAAGMGTQRQRQGPRDAKNLPQGRWQIWLDYSQPGAVRSHNDMRAFNRHGRRVESVWPRTSRRRKSQGSGPGPLDGAGRGSDPARQFLVVAVVAANILPAIVGLNPTGIIAVIVVRTTKAKREEIAVVESMMEVVMEVVTTSCRASAPSLNTSASHRRCGDPATTHWAHISPMHHHGPRTTSWCSGNARSPETTATPKTTAAETGGAVTATTTAAETTAAVTTTAAAATTTTAAAAATTVSCHGGRAEAQCHN
jgi:hypothetical protein